MAETRRDSGERREEREASNARDVDETRNRWNEQRSERDDLARRRAEHQSALTQREREARWPIG